MKKFLFMMLIASIVCFAEKVTVTAAPFGGDGIYVLEDTYLVVIDSTNFPSVRNLIVGDLIEVDMDCIRNDMIFDCEGYKNGRLEVLYSVLSLGTLSSKAMSYYQFISFTKSNTNYVVNALRGYKKIGGLLWDDYIEEQIDGIFGKVLFSDLENHLPDFQPFNGSFYPFYDMLDPTCLLGVIYWSKEDHYFTSDESVILVTLGGEDGGMFF